MRDITRGDMLGPHVVNAPQAIKNSLLFVHCRSAVEQFSGASKDAQSFRRGIAFGRPHHLAEREMEIELSPVAIGRCWE